MNAVSHQERVPRQRDRGGSRVARAPGGRGAARRIELRWALLAAIVLLVVSLCYKLTLVGVMVLLALGVLVLVCRDTFRRLDLVFVLALAYVADATVTAFMVSYHAGEARTVQFCIMAVALIGLYAYAQSAKRADADFLLKGLGLLCVLVTAHLVIWHVLHHHLVTWKYLSDTKLILSLALIPLFGLEDWIKNKSRVLFPAALLVAFTIILLSGERKALTLYCGLFVLCRIPLTAKLGLAALIAIVIEIALLGDDGYIHRQLTSGSHDYSHASVRYFFTVPSIYQQSDIIREFVNRNAWAMFLRHPGFGMGATGYWTWGLKTYGVTGLGMNVHGEVHRIPAEGGVFGIAIACGFLGIALWRALRHVAKAGGFAAASLDRAPLYCIVLLVSYCYAEAVDTAMLLLIGGVGVIAGTLPAARSSLRAGRARPVRRGSPGLQAPGLSGSLRRRA